MFGINWDSISRMQLGMSGILVLVVFFLIALLYVWHKDSKSKVDLKDLICRNERIDEKKFTRFGAWIVSTWGFVYLILDNKFTEWYFFGYMSVWVSNVILDKYLNNRSIELQGAKNVQQPKGA